MVIPIKQWAKHQKAVTGYKHELCAFKIDVGAASGAQRAESGDFASYAAEAAQKKKSKRITLFDAIKSITKSFVTLPV